MNGVSASAGEALLEQSTGHEVSGSYDEALSSATQAVEAFEAQGDVLGLRVALLYSGRLALLAGQYLQASRVLQRAHDFSPTSDDRLQVLPLVVEAKRRCGRLEEALLWIDGWFAAQSAELNRCPQTSAAPLLAKADVLADLGRFEEAETTCREGFLVAEGDDLARAGALLVASRIALRLGEGSRSQTLLVHATQLATAAAGENHPQRLVFAETSADWLLRFGPPLAARPLYRALLAACCASVGERHPEAAKLMVRLGQVSAAAGDPEGAIATLDQAVAILEAIFASDHPDLGEALHAMGASALSAGSYAIARKALQRAAAIQAVRPFVRSSATLDLARLEMEAGNLEVARSLSQEARRRLEQTPCPQPSAVAETLSISAGIHFRLGNLTDAEAEIRRALALRKVDLPSVLSSAHADLAETLIDLGQIQLASGLASYAAATFLRAEETLRKVYGRNHPRQSRVLLGRAAASFALRDFDSSRNFAVLGYAVAAADPRREQTSALSALLADLCEIAGRLDAAIYFGKVSISLTIFRSDPGIREAPFRLSSKHGRPEAHHSLADRLIRCGRLAEADQVLRRLKYRELTLGLRDAVNVAGEPELSLNAREERWEIHRADLRRQMAVKLKASAEVGDGLPALAVQQAALRDLETDQAVIVQKIGDWAKRLMTESDVIPRAFVGLGGGRLAPPPGHAEIDYLMVGEEVRLMVRTDRGRLNATLEESSTAVARRAYALWSALRAGHRDYLHLAQELYRVLLLPIAEDLETAGAATLSLSLDGPLRYIPFAALHDGSRFLAQRLAVVVRAGAAPQSSRSNSDGGAAIFGADHKSVVLPTLVHVRRELEAVRVALGERNVGFNEGFTRLTLSRALQAKPRVAHLATHFAFLPGRELSSWLALGDGERLSVEELLTSEFPMEGLELLSLSACETALSTSLAEDGRELESLPAAFIRAGASAVLATLWPIEDEASASLIACFYEEWLKGSAPPEALRLAQTSNVDRLGASHNRGLFEEEHPDAEEADAEPHPHRWAGFQLTIGG